MVGARGFEPPASRSRTVRSTRLSYAPSDGQIKRPFSGHASGFSLQWLRKDSAGQNPGQEHPDEEVGDRSWLWTLI